MNDALPANPNSTPNPQKCPTTPPWDMGQSGTFRDIHDPTSPESNPDSTQPAPDPSQHTLSSEDPLSNNDLEDDPEEDDPEEDSGPLTHIQQRAIELTLQGLTDARVARTLNINRKTLWRWKTLDEFYRLALAEARGQFHEFSVDRYQTLLQKATAVLEEFLDGKADNYRFRAAHAFLVLATRFRHAPAPKLSERHEPEPDIPTHWA